MPRTVVCVYCRQEEVASSRDLVAPCKCGKKDEDRGRWHRACLVEYLRDVEEEHPDYRVEHERCPTCNEPYQIRVESRFDCDWAHVLRAKALGHAYELIMIAVTMVMLVGAFYLTLSDAIHEMKEEAHPPTDPEARLRRLRHLQRFGGHAPTGTTIAIMVAGFALALILVVFTLRRIAERWKRASSDVIIEA